VFMIFFFFKYKYEPEAKGLSIYYVIINGLNIANMIFHTVTNYNFLFTFSMLTKTVELFIVVRLLIRNIKSRRL
jgi:hypothetical protein